MKKYIAFELSMPGCNSWNNKWSGESSSHVIVKSFNDTKKNAERFKNIEKSYSYSFGDGWRASIYVTIVDGKEARKLKKNSCGFAGYDWMVSSILAKGEITTAKG